MYIRFVAVKSFIAYCGKNVNIEHGAIFSKKLKIGDNSGIGIDCQLNGMVSIGKNVLMGPEVMMFTQNHNFSRIDIPIKDQGNTKEYPITIGDDVWIGARVIILPGVKVGNGAIIGAGSVVTKTIPNLTVVAGNPAKIIGVRGDIKSEN